MVIQFQGGGLQNQPPVKPSHPPCLLNKGGNLTIPPKSSLFMKKAVEKQNPIETKLFKKTWRTLNCSPKTIKVIREIQENLLCVGKRRQLITKKTTDTKCWCTKAGPELNAKHIVSAEEKYPERSTPTMASWSTSSSTTSSSREGSLPTSKNGRTGRL